MLIIPTSLDTAIMFELRYPLIWSTVAYTCLTIGAYCLWEMLASLLTGTKPRSSRWLWLAAAVVFLFAGALSSSIMFGPVTFNADRGDWVSTSWGWVLGGALMAAFAVCVVVILVLRAADVVRSSRSGQRLHLAWRLLGLCVMAAYGILLAVNDTMLFGPVLENAAMAGGFVLAVSGIGSLIALAVIQRMRTIRNSEAQATSV